MAGLPYSTRAQRALALAESAATAEGNECIGTEHLLLGLLAERTGPAAQILTHLGVTDEQVRRIIAGFRPAQ